MVDALKSILGFFETLLDFVGFLISGLAELLLMIPSAFTMLTYSIGFCLLFCWHLLLLLLRFLLCFSLSIVRGCLRDFV